MTWAEDLCSISNIPSQPARCQKYKVHPEPVTNAVLPDFCTPCARVNKHQCGVLFSVNKNPSKMAAAPHFGGGNTALTASKVHKYFLQEKRLFHWEWFLSHTKLAPPRIQRCQEAASQLPQKWSVQGSSPVLFQLTPAGTACYCWVQLFVFNAVNFSVPFSKKGVRTRHKHAGNTRKTFRGRTKCTLHNWEWRLLKPAKWKGLTLFSSQNCRPGLDFEK